MTQIIKHINNIKANHYREKSRAEMASNGFRKARTRTLIQLGGLVEKSGLFNTLGIIPGADLQKDPQMTQKALSLLGALAEINMMIKEDITSLEYLALKGKRVFHSLEDKSAISNESLPSK